MERNNLKCVTFQSALVLFTILVRKLNETQTEEKREKKAEVERIMTFSCSES